MLLHHSAERPRRQGVILLIVVIMLALFLVLGLAFMFFAESEASASRIYREAFSVNYDRADIDPQLLLNWAMGQLVYDCSDLGDGVYSAMRGHSLARNMYGWNYRSVPGTGQIIAGANNNTIAFNGLGKISGAFMNPPPELATVTDQTLLINYTYFPNYSNLAASYLRDPERTGYRTGGLAAPDTIDIYANPGTYTGGWNAPYTYPDRNNVFLAALRAKHPDNGGGPDVMMQSFYRPGGTPFDVAQPNHTQLTNPNPWLDPNPALKYMVLRPRPVDMYWGGPNDPHSFPLPASDTGDVQNLPGGVGNDSFWMDLGYPVMVTRGGTKFKPLFAFLVVDLDNRVNVNVHGNIRGQNQTHVSNQGIAKSEVNLNKVMTADPNEVKNVFGNQAAGITGRYGANFQPGPTGALYPDYQTGTLRSYLNRVDFDGGVDDNGNPTTRFQFPAQYQTQPTYTAGYDDLIPGSGSQNALTYNPMMYNPLNVLRDGANDDIAFGIKDNLYYLIGAASGPNHQRATLYQQNRIQHNLDQPSIRQMLTTLSADLETPGARPWITNPAQAPYTLNQPTTPGPYLPMGAPSGFTLSQSPSTVNTQAAPVPGSEFLADDGRCAVYPRLDLNRKLTPYPTDISFFKPVTSGGQLPVPAPTGMPPTVAQDPRYQYYRAVWERQKFAAEIFDRLVQATGAPALDGSGNPYAPGTPQHNARRYLAQLAVNIVDYLDDDEFSTPFVWDQFNPNPPQIVYGIESPNLVLNEVYGEIRNDRADQGQLFATQPFQLHFWVELFNPRSKAQLPNAALNNDTLTGDNRADVQLKNWNNDPVYRLQFFDDTTLPPNALLQLNNTDGSIPGVVAKLQTQDWDLNTPGPMPTPGLPMPERIKVHSVDPMAPGFPNGVAGTPGTAAGQNVDGFYVVASANDIETPTTPNQEPTNRLPSVPGGGGQPALGLSYTLPLAQNVPNHPPHTVLLQRLACPHLPPNPDPAAGLLYNPYITVDYVPSVPVWDAVTVVEPVIPGSPAPHTGDPAANRRSKARKQPLEAALSVAPTAPAQSFFNQNDPTSNGQFDWLVHLNRPPISLAEILHVSPFKPYELTQFFVGPANYEQHSAPWTNDSTRLYRALEFLTVGDRSYWSSYAPGTPTQQSSGGRIVGRININDVWDREILDALTDPQPVNFFTEADVTTAFQAMLKRRNSHLVPQAEQPQGFTGVDAPYMSFANVGAGGNPNFPTKEGVAGTVLGSGEFQGQTAARQQSPYITREMLTKIANSMTTRSNVFAVYLTVGFFEVMDDTVRPVRLGAEIRARNGLPVRHKMFAVVDRTQLAIEDPGFVQPSATDPAPGLVQVGGDLFPQFFLTSEDAITPEMLPPLAAGQQTINIVGGIAPNMAYDGKFTNLAATSTPSTPLYADVGSQQETLTNWSISGGKLTAQFTKPHAAGFMISRYRPGNPGPQGSIDLTNPRYKQVVPYTTIIQ